MYVLHRRFTAYVTTSSMGGCVSAFPLYMCTQIDAFLKDLEDEDRSPEELAAIRSAAENMDMEKVGTQFIAIVGYYARLET